MRSHCHSSACCVPRSSTSVGRRQKLWKALPTRRQPAAFVEALADPDSDVRPGGCRGLSGDRRIGSEAAIGAADVHARSRDASPQRIVPRAHHVLYRLAKQVPASTRHCSGRCSRRNRDWRCRRWPRYCFFRSWGSREAIRLLRQHYRGIRNRPHSAGLGWHETLIHQIKVKGNEAIVNANVKQR